MAAKEKETGLRIKKSMWPPRGGDEFSERERALTKPDLPALVHVVL